MRFIQSRCVPKSGQTVSYADGDDGFHQAGWWKGRTVANNKDRFVSKTLLTDDVVIDRATGLMWAADGDEKGCNWGGTTVWSMAILFANALNFAGFTDWRLPNIIELFSIMSFQHKNPCIDLVFFPNTPVNPQHSSSTVYNATDYSLIMDLELPQIYKGAKTLSTPLRCVRGGI